MFLISYIYLSFLPFYPSHSFLFTVITLLLCPEPRKPLLFLRQPILVPTLHSQISIEAAITTSPAETYMSKSTIHFFECTATSLFTSPSSGKVSYEETQRDEHSVIPFNWSMPSPFLCPVHQTPSRTFYRFSIIHCIRL